MHAWRVDECFGQWFDIRPPGFYILKQIWTKSIYRHWDTLPKAMLPTTLQQHKKKQNCDQKQGAQTFSSTLLGGERQRAWKCQQNKLRQREDNDSEMMAFNRIYSSDSWARQLQIWRKPCSLISAPHQFKVFSIQMERLTVVPRSIPMTVPKLSLVSPFATSAPTKPTDHRAHNTISAPSHQNGSMHIFCALQYGSVPIGLVKRLAHLVQRPRERPATSFCNSSAPMPIL